MVLWQRKLKVLLDGHVLRIDSGEQRPFDASVDWAACERLQSLPPDVNGSLSSCEPALKSHGEQLWLDRHMKYEMNGLWTPLCRRPARLWVSVAEMLLAR